VPRYVSDVAPSLCIVYADSFKPSSDRRKGHNAHGCCNDRQDSLTGNTRPYFTQGLAFFEIAATDSGEFSAVTLVGLAGPRNERKEPDSTRNGERCQTLSLKLSYGNYVNKVARTAAAAIFIEKTES